MYVVIFVTASSKKEARTIASALIKRKLAACVNIINGIESLFWWQGKVESAKENLLIIKSKTTKLLAIIKAVKAHHSYEVPEIIALPIKGGFTPYLRWIDASVR